MILDQYLPIENYATGNRNIFKNDGVLYHDQWPHTDYPPKKIKYYY